MKIALALSRENFQSRFTHNFAEIPYLPNTQNQTIQGIVVNKMCKPSMDIFKREDHGMIFHNNHLWLFIDSNSTMGIIESIVSTLIDQERRTDNYKNDQNFISGTIQN